MTWIICVATAFLLLGIVASVIRMLRWRRLSPKEHFQVILDATLWLPLEVSVVLYFTGVVAGRFLTWAGVAVGTVFVLQTAAYITLEKLIRCGSTSTGWFYRCVVFRFFQWKLRTLAPKHPLMTFPFMAFVELELPQVFKDGGMKAAYASALGWGDRFESKFKRAVDDMVGPWRASRVEPPANDTVGRVKVDDAERGSVERRRL